MLAFTMVWLSCGLGMVTIFGLAIYFANGGGLRDLPRRIWRGKDTTRNA